MIFRTLFFIFVMVPFLIIGVPVQFVITKLGMFSPFLTMLFHRIGCIFCGLRVHVIGEPLHNRPTLLLSNHISWTDIVAIGSVADVTFVSKTGVRDTFFVGFMATLQRTLFVDYNRRADAMRTSREMAQRLIRSSCFRRARWRASMTTFGSIRISRRGIRAARRSSACTKP